MIGVNPVFRFGTLLNSYLIGQALLVDGGMILAL
jgi:hypothetical protein